MVSSKMAKWTYLPRRNNKVNTRMYCKMDLSKTLFVKVIGLTYHGIHGYKDSNKCDRNF